MANVIVDENIPLLYDVLRGVSDVKVAPGRAINNDMLLERDCNGLIVRSITKINAKLLAGTNVEFVGTSTSGIDHVDLTFLEENDIAFAYAPGSNANSVAEYIVYAVLMWARANDIPLDGKTIGIVGFGNIGRIVAYYANALGLEVLVNDPPLLNSGFDFPEYVRHVQIMELCEIADIVTNHVPLTKEGKYPTWRLFSTNEINSLKKGSLFIHTSRGYVADESALLERIAKREITAVIDVWENEPAVNSTLVKYCFLATPHIAGYAYDGKLKGALMMAEAFEKHFNLVVNKQILLDELQSGAEQISIKSPANMILEHLETNRRLRDDYVAFLKTMLIDDEVQRGVEFDMLRKKYPKRRECLIQEK